MNKVKSTITEQDIPYKLPENWTWYYWGDIIQEYQQGLIRSNSELGDIGFEYFKMNNISDDGTYNFDNLQKTEATEKECETYSIKNSDFFINVRNSRELVGKSCVIGNVDRTILFNHMLIRISHKDYIANEFINAFFNIPSSKKMIERCKQGTTTVIALYQNDLYKIPIAVPDIETHNKIVAFYKNISSKIELNNKINKELENLAKTIYEYWFVQNAGEEWERKRIGEMAEVIRGTMITEKQTKEGNIKVVAGGIHYSYFHSEFNRERNTITVSGSGANAGFVNFWHERIFASDCTTVRGKNDIDTFLIFQHLKFNQENIFRSAKGSAQPHVYPSDIKDIWFYEIPQNIKNKFGLIFTTINEQIAKQLLENTNLAHLRDFLLPLLMNGQVTVGDVQDEPTIIPFNNFADSDTKYQTWKEQIGLAARGNIDEQTLRNIYEAIDENDR